MRRHRYYNRYPRRTTFSYFRPFVFLAIVGIVLYYGYSLLLGGSSLESTKSESPGVFFSIEKGSAKILLWGKENWHNAPDGVKLFQGDTIKTDVDSRAKLIFFDHSIFRLNSRTRIGLDYLTGALSPRFFQISFYEGDMWVNIEEMEDSNSHVEISTPAYVLTSSHGTFSIEDDAIRCVSGKGSVKIVDPEEQGSYLKEVDIGVGQQIILTQELLSELKTSDQTEIIFAFSDSFKESDWYKWNQRKDGNILSFEELPDEDTSDSQSSTEDGDGTVSFDEIEDAETGVVTRDDDNRLSITTPAQNAAVNKKQVRVEGRIHDETIVKVKVGNVFAKISNTRFVADGVALPQEGGNTVPIRVVDLDGKESQILTLKLTRDTVRPSSPDIVTPTLGQSRSFEVTSGVQEIVGKVPQEAYKVIVSYFQDGEYASYALDRFVPGSGRFQYYAKKEYGNLKEGENKYRVTVEDRAGNASEAVYFTLVYIPSDESESVDEDAAKDTSEEKVTIVGSTQLVITAPNNGKAIVLKEVPIFLRGTTPETADRLMVNDKRVSTYTPGNTLWAYKLDPSYGNLKMGDNLIHVEAYDAAGTKLGEASMTIMLKLDTVITPSITQPSSNARFRSPTKTLILGGTCGPETVKIYVNDKAIAYEVAKIQWSTSVSFLRGDNIYRVVAEDASGKKSDVAEIVIEY